MSPRSTDDPANAASAASAQIRKILARLRRARSVDEGDACVDELWDIARRDPQPILDAYRRSRTNRFALVWCLQGLTSDAVREVLADAVTSPEANVRWAALEGLKHFHDADLTPLFATALKDRYDMSKCVAVEWLAAHGDARAIAPLERFAALPSQIRSSPGLVKRAQATLVRLRGQPAQPRGNVSP
jgi:hypothetical protein